MTEAPKQNYVRYRNDVEVIDPGEQETFDKIVQAMAKGGVLVSGKTRQGVSNLARQGSKESSPPYLAPPLFFTPSANRTSVRCLSVMATTLPSLSVTADTPGPIERLIFPLQNAYSPARQSFVEDSLSFCPAHSLVAHRPLGSIMRARMQAYELLAKARRG